MKKILVVIMVFLLLGCSAQAGVQMSTFTGFSSGSTHVNMIEPSSGDSLEYMRVGNNSAGTAYWEIIPLPSGFPTEGEVESAILRLSETTSSYRGDNPLTIKVSPVTGAWSTSTKWNTVPAYNSGVVATYLLNTAEPSSSNYDYRDGYHAARYKYVSNSGAVKYYDKKYASISYIEDGKIVWYYYDSTIPAYYDTYIKYHNIDITAVAQYCIDNACTGLLIYFDTSGANDTRKYFKSPENTSEYYMPRVTVALSDSEPYENPPLTIAPTQGSINKQVIAMWIAPDAGAIDKQIVGMSIAPTQGSISKTVF